MALPDHCTAHRLRLAQRQPCLNARHAAAQSRRLKGGLAAQLHPQTLEALSGAQFNAKACPQKRVDQPVLRRAGQGQKQEKERTAHAVGRASSRRIRRAAWHEPEGAAQNCEAAVLELARTTP
ncbi:hypothetical protein ARSEF1564_005807 [Beauveria bassiana]